jgi:hypothetical protein
VLCAAVLFALACGDDTTEPKKCQDCEWPDPNTRANVLQTIELSYNKRNIQRYAAILDDDFIMYFASADVAAGKTPTQWGRQEEIDAARHMFDPAYDDPDQSSPRVLKLFLDVQWEDGVVWQEVHPESAPEETWYAGTVYYNIQLDVEPDNHLINSSGTKAQFTLRNAGTNETPRWQVVEMRDLSNVSVPAQSNGPLGLTWGQIKVMFL